MAEAFLLQCSNIKQPMCLQQLMEKDYGVIYTTTDKSTITDKKIIYYNPYKVNQYTFEDNNPFGWLKEIFIAWTKALLIGFLLIFISSYITRE